jgi:quercetin dioxygenase-like cupin family protein
LLQLRNNLIQIEGDTMTRYIASLKAAALVLLSLITLPSIAENVKPLLAKDLIGLAGKQGMMLTVEYEPGASSTKHRHDAHVFVYVLEGSVIMQVEGGKAVTLGPGETFYESPKDVHSVSKNASATKPAKFLVFIVKDKDKPPVLPAK